MFCLTETLVARLLVYVASMISFVGCDGGVHRRSLPPPTTSTTVIADFSKGTDQPLLKDKFGVYQTPFMGTDGIAPLTAMQPFLAEAGVRDLRYETAWGKPDVYAYKQIAGTAAAPVIDFSQLDPFLTMLHANGVEPLLAVGYNPLPLQSCKTADTICWQSPPSNYSGWDSILSQVSAHYSTYLGISGVQYEMWNEPDISSGTTKTFFSGSQTDYGNVYQHGVAGVKNGVENVAGVADALVGGPAIAYDTTYITRSGMLRQPVDFVSIHAYANYSSQISALRSVVNTSSPLYMTEYGSYTTQGITDPNSTHVGAMQFFADINLMLNDPDVPKVYWAQWIDDSDGMITYGLHRKAIFNAYKIYETMLPVDRVSAVTSTSSTGIGTMAGSDAHTAGIVVWNTSLTAQAVTVQLNNLPFATGTLMQWYIDQNHASFEDNAPETLTSGGDSTAKITGSSPTWTGTIQPQSLIYVHVTDGSTSSLAANKIGIYGGDHFYFASHPGVAYADFDPTTSIARVGMGSAATGAAIAANIYDLPSATSMLNVSVIKSGPFSLNSANSLFGVHVDFQNTSGAYDKAVLYTDGVLYNAKRTLAMPWGTARAVPDTVKRYTGGLFSINFAAVAPADWNGKRVIITPLLVDAGAESKARIQFTLAP
jgi:Glycosyl hydrolases family 39